jgi:hypothetical protein
LSNKGNLSTMLERPFAGILLSKSGFWRSIRKPLP